MVKNHIKEIVESKLPKNSPFVCPKNGCFYNHHTSRFQNFNALYMHYHQKHTQLNMEFLEMNNDHNNQKNETKSSLNLHEKEKYYAKKMNKGPSNEKTSHSELKFRKKSIFAGQKMHFFLHFQKYKNTFFDLFKRTKTHFLLLQKWEKIHFCTKKCLKL